MTTTLPSTARDKAHGVSAVGFVVRRREAGEMVCKRADIQDTKAGSPVGSIRSTTYFYLNVCLGGCISSAMDLQQKWNDKSRHQRALEVITKLESRGNDASLLAAIEAAEEITTQQAQLIYAMREAFMQGHTECAMQFAKAIAGITTPQQKGNDNDDRKQPQGHRANPSEHGDAGRGRPRGSKFAARPEPQNSAA